MAQQNKNIWTQQFELYVGIKIFYYKNNMWPLWLKKILSN